MRDPLGKMAVGLKPSGIRKFFDIVSEMDDVVSLGVGEPDFDTPWVIRDEGIYTLERGKTFYTSNSGLMEQSYQMIALSELTAGIAVILAVGAVYFLKRILTRPMKISKNLL